MEVVHMSSLISKAKIEAFGEITHANKWLNLDTPMVVSDHKGKYTIKRVNMPVTFVLGWCTDEYQLQVGMSNEYDTLYVWGIKVANRGEGVGTVVMNKILDHCDLHGLKCKLHPFPLEYVNFERSNKTKILQQFYSLRKWYTSFGFVWSPDGHMTYTPTCSYP
jgi:hypothetical protein